MSCQFVGLYPPSHFNLAVRPKLLSSEREHRNIKRDNWLTRESPIHRLIPKLLGAPPSRSRLGFRPIPS